MTLLFGIVAGLVIGWFVWPAPAWVVTLRDLVVSKFSKK